jgi:hypothetical protein
MDQQDALSQAQKAGRIANESQIRGDSLSRLRTIANRKFRTCFIFPIAEFEKVFGLEIWGHGLPEERLTPQQRANRQRWELVRTSILNNGNTQSRALQAELELHDVRFKGYRVELRGEEEHGS